jgi:hypothetical protein
MATSRSKLPSPGTGGGSITRGLLRAGMGLLKTTGKIYNALVGPEQEQTYGWTSQFFPRKTRDNKKSKVDSLSKNFGSIPKMSVDTDEILNLLKENYADEKRYREIQKSFAEERANEEERRHNQLVTALKKFTATGTTATVVTEKEGGGLLDMIRNMFSAFEEKVKGMIDAALSGIELFKKGSLLSSLLTFLKSPIFKLLSGPLLMVAGILGLAELFSAAVKFMPDYSKLTAEEAKAALEGNDPGLIKKYGGREKLMKIIDREKQLAREALDSEEDLTEEQRAKYQKILDLTVAPQTETQLGNVPPRPDTTGGKNKARAMSWDAKFEETHNPDGTPKVQTPAKPLVPGSEESQAGAGRGSGQYEDFLARMDEEQTGGQASFGVRPQGVKSVPVASPPSPVAQLTDMNRDLEMNFSTTSGGSSGAPVIQQSNTQSAQNEPPIPSTATQRDDEAMSSKVFKDQRNRARAY